MSFDSNMDNEIFRNDIPLSPSFILNDYPPRKSKPDNETKKVKDQGENDEEIIRSIEGGAEESNIAKIKNTISSELTPQSIFNQFKKILSEHFWVIAALLLIIAVLVGIIHLQNKTGQPLGQILSSFGLWSASNDVGKKKKKRKKPKHDDEPPPELTIEELFQQDDQEMQPDENDLFL